MSKWTHAVCKTCWIERNPDIPNPVRIADEFREIETCCFCGERTSSGIYEREDPAIPQFCQHDKGEQNANV